MKGGPRNLANCVKRRGRAAEQAGIQLSLLYGCARRCVDLFASSEKVGFVSRINLEKEWKKRMSDKRFLKSVAGCVQVEVKQKKA